jgi:hypothetical protein
MSDTENGLPNSGEDATNVDSGKGGASTSNDVLSGVTLKQVEELLDRKFQSFKDKRMGALEKQVNVISERLAKDLEKEGFDPDEVKQVTDRLRKPSESKSETTPTQSPGTGKAEMPETDKILEASGLKLDDPDVLALKQQTFASSQEEMVAVASLVAKRANPKPASQAATPPPTGRSTAARDVETITAELEALNKASGKFDFKKAQELQEELKSLL